jgi:glycosyltransferase involved in cell wall biosynthesis
VILGVNGIRLVGKRSGVARAIEAVLNCLGEMEQPFDDIRVYSPRPIDPAVRLPAIARNVVVPSPLPQGLWEQITLPAAHGGKDVLFCPSYVMPLFAGCPTLLAHHGSYEGYSGAAEVFSRWTRLKARVMYHLSAQRATIVTTVSQYSKQDMVYYYRLHPRRIHVVPEGVDTRLFRPIHDRAALADWRQRALGGDTPFLLYVGKPTRRRNLPNLLAAFRRLKREHGLPHKLVMIGSALPGTSFAQDIRALGLEEEIVDVPYASHDDIALAYNACAAMIYPSSYEGFGMPVLEAMACGAPVITLDNTAFPEFAGGVAMLLPNAEVQTLVSAIWELLNDPQRRRCMAEAGPRRAAAYDWRIVTAQYLELLKRLIPCSERNG